MTTRADRWIVELLLACSMWLAGGGLSVLYGQDTTTVPTAESAGAPDAQAPVAPNPAADSGTPAAVEAAVPAPDSSPVVAPSSSSGAEPGVGAAPVSAGGAPKSAVAPKPVPIPYQEQIYQVAITLGVDPDAELTTQDVGRVVTQLRGMVESRIGMWWKCDIVVAGAGDPVNQAMLVSRKEASWNETLEPTNFDKKFALTVDRVGTQYRVSGIEWDRASQSITTVQTRATFDRRLLAALASEVVFDRFRPLVSIDQVTEGRVEMRIRGGEFLPPDVSLVPFKVGDHVSGFVRHLGKNRELKRLQTIPWTVIRVDQIDRSYLGGTTISAFKSPLAFNRRRMEILGLKVHTTHPATRLQVIPRGKPQAPLAGYRVEILNRPETKEDKVEDRVTLRTDRKGEVTIPADPDKPVRYVIVYSGAAPLAKTPIIPGNAERLVLEVPDDTPRLNVEVETDLLQSELVDIVARREVLMARARTASKNGEWELVSEMQKKIAELPTLEQFQTRIDALKNPGVQVAKRHRDRAQESRIIRMCKEITEMATQHLDPLKVKEFTQQIEEERKAK